MPSYKTAFGSYLKTEDLQGRNVRAVIEDVQIEEVKGDDGLEKKLVMRFIGKEKALILNRTNCEALEQILGTDDYASWSGHSVVLYPTTTKFGAKVVPCLRIRAPQNGHVVAPPPPPRVDESELDEIPFAWVLPLLLPLTMLGMVVA